MRRFLGLAAPAVWLGVFMWSVVAHGQGQTPPAPQRQGGTPASSWTIPQGGAQEKNPLTVNDAVLAKGKELFGTKCSRCHGAAGKGDGSEGDPAHKEDMDLTRADRAPRNPDGMVFYKMWNGRGTPKMPAFSEQLTKEQAWAIVAYVQTLRAK